MSTFEYGEVRFASYQRVRSWILGSNSESLGPDLVDFPWQEEVFDDRSWRSGPPSAVVNHLGARGWEVLQVTEQEAAGDLFKQFYVKRSSEDRRALTA